MIARLRDGDLVTIDAKAGTVTVDIEAPVSATVDEMAWLGPQPGFDKRCVAIGAQRQAARLHELWAERGADHG